MPRVSSASFRLLAAGLTAIAILALAPLTASGQDRALRLVSTPWTPFTNLPDEPRFALDLVDEALSRIGMRADTAIVSPTDFATLLANGTFDGSAAVWRDQARESVLLYSEPYLQNRLVLVGRRGSDVSAPSFAELTGRRVAIVEGYAYGEAVDEIDGPEFVRTANAQTGLQMLIDGDVDYALVDELVVEYVLRDNGEAAANALVIAMTPILTRSLHFAVRRDLPDAEAIIERFNAQLQVMVADRSYHRLLHLDWIRADIDGDGLAEYIPQSDEQVPDLPERGGYNLFRTSEFETEPETGRRFFIGGTLYTGWAHVPDMYKVKGEDRPDPNRSVIPIFGFTW